MLRAAFLLAFACVVASACGSTTPSSPSKTPSAPSQTPRAIDVGIAGNAAPALPPGQSRQFWALGRFADGSSTDLTNSALWKSSSPAIATVSSTGLVTASSVGHVDITATIDSMVGTLAVDVVSTCFFTLEPNYLIFGAFGDSRSVTVTPSASSCRWTAASDAAWFPFTFDPRVSGTGIFSYTVPANTSTESRSAKIIVSSTDGGSAALTVEQEKPLCSYAATPDRTQIPTSGGQFSFRVHTSPSDCSWNVVPTNGPGITVTSAVSGNVGDGTVTFTVASSVSSLGSIRVVPVPATSPPFSHLLVR